MFRGVRDVYLLICTLGIFIAGSRFTESMKQRALCFFLCVLWERLLCDTKILESMLYVLLQMDACCVKSNLVFIGV